MTVSNAYLRDTVTSQEQIVERGLFELLTLIDTITNQQPTAGDRRVTSRVAP